MVTFRNIVRLMLVIGVAGLFGCGGGGDGGGSPAPNAPPVPAKATTTVSGKVDFPSLSSLVAKRVNAPGDKVYVQAYTIDGLKVGSQVEADAATGSFTIPGLDSGVDYVLKASRGTQVLKKLIEKVAVAPGVTVTDQNISGVSTTAVVIASQKLAPVGVTAFNLGEPTALTEIQKAEMSTNIFKVVSPKDLETAISNAKTTVQDAITGGTLSSLTDKDLADLVNTLNLIVAAVSSNTDPTSGQLQSFTVPAGVLKPLEFNAGAIQQAAAITTVSPADVKLTITSSIAAYTPPSRVQLDISSNVAAGTLAGITFDIIIPAGAIVKLDANGYPDLAAMSLAPGVTLSCFKEANLTGNVLRVLIADVSPLPSGRLVSFVFDKTAGTTLQSSDFPVSYSSTTDIAGHVLLNSFVLTGTVTSSGS